MSSSSSTSSTSLTTAEKTDGTLTVLSGPQQIAPDLYAIHGRFACAQGLVFPLCMMVIRLPDTDSLLVYSPFNPSLIDLTELGSVTAIIAPSAVHGTYAQDFAAAHPAATLYSSPALAARFPARDWGTVLTPATPLDVISPYTPLRLFSAFLFQEVVVLHAPTGSLLAADLAFNFTPALLAQTPLLTRFFLHTVRGTRPLDWSISVKILARSGCKQGLPQMDALLDEWEWDRFVPCHGAVVEKDAKRVFREGTYSYVRAVAHGSNGLWTRVAVVAVVAMLIGIGLKWRAGPSE